MAKTPSRPTCMAEKKFMRSWNSRSSCIPCCQRRLTSSAGGRASGVSGAADMAEGLSGVTLRFSWTVSPDERAHRPLDPCRITPSMLPDPAGRFAGEFAGRPVFYCVLPTPPPPGSGQAVADDGGGAGGIGRTRKTIPNPWRTIDGPSGQFKQPRIRRTPALDDPGGHGGRRRPGPGPREGGRLLRRRARPAAVGPGPGTPRRWPHAPRPGRRLDPRRPAHALEHRAVGGARGRVPMLEDHLARLAARPAIRFARRAEGPGLGLQPGRGHRPGPRARVRHAQPLVGVRAGRGRAPDPAAPRVARPRHLLAARRLLGPDRRRRPDGCARGAGPADRLPPPEGRARRPRRADDGARARRARPAADTPGP